MISADRRPARAAARGGAGAGREDRQELAGRDARDEAGAVGRARAGPHRRVPGRRARSSCRCGATPTRPKGPLAFAEKREPQWSAARRPASTIAVSREPRRRSSSDGDDDADDRRRSTPAAPTITRGRARDRAPTAIATRAAPTAGPEPGQAGRRDAAQRRRRSSPRCSGSGSPAACTCRSTRGSPPDELAHVLAAVDPPRSSRPPTTPPASSTCRSSSPATARVAAAGPVDARQRHDRRWRRAHPVHVGHDRRARSRCRCRTTACSS